MRAFWRKQPKWLWAIAAGAVMVEVGGALVSVAKGRQRQHTDNRP